MTTEEIRHVTQPLASTLSLARGRKVAVVLVMTVLAAILVVAVRAPEADAASNTLWPRLESLDCSYGSGGGVLGKRANVNPGVIYYAGYELPQYITENTLPSTEAYVWIYAANRYGNVIQTGWRGWSSQPSVSITDESIYDVWIYTAWRDPGFGNNYAYKGWTYLGAC